MTTHRRVVRAHSTETDWLVPSTTHRSTIWGFFLKICRIMWSVLKYIWYWFERVFFLVFLTVLTVWLAWWLSQTPSLYRDWDPIDEILPEITWSGNVVTIDHIRDHNWKTDKEFIPGYQKGDYSLDDIEGLSYIITPFSDRDGPAHTMFDFSFSWGRHIVISGEIRKERGEDFEVIRGVLNQYELAYVIATEDDIIKLRTNYRKNHVYMYPIKTEKEKIQLLFRSMLIRADKLSREPEFYNTFWNNCTTSILSHVNALRIEKLDGWIYTLLPSHSDEVIYNAGLIDTQLSLSGAREYYRIDEWARMVSGETSFSTLIRKPIQ